MNRLTAEANGLDVIGVTETWWDRTTDPDRTLLKGYHTPIRCDREGWGGGVAIFVKEPYIAKHIPELTIPGLEAVWVKVSNQNKHMLVGVIYREPRSKVEYWDKVEEALEQAKLQGIPDIIVMGDLNDDQLRPKSKLKKLCNEYHLEQIITEPTHQNALIDVILVSSPDTVTRSGVTPQSLSNHNAVYADFNFRQSKPIKYKRTVFHYSQANWDGLKDELKHFNWNDTLRKENASEMVKHWTNTFTKIIKKHIPTKHVTIYHNDAPWMTTKIHRIMQTRRNLYKKAKTSHRDQDWGNYKKCRNTVVDEIRKAKESHEKKLEQRINEASANNDKIWWKLVKEVLNKQRSTNSPPLQVNGETISSPLAKANAFNKYFADQTHLDAQDEPPAINNPTANRTLTNIRISYLSVKEVLATLKPNKANGPDKISPRILIKTAEEIAPSLAIIFNFSLQTCSFPELWKLAQVTPLYKQKGDKHSPKNYRPISLLSCIGKVMERCVFNQVFSYLLQENLLSKFQGAYTPNSSTVTQLIDIYHQIQTALDGGKDIRFLFLDISKAFDKLWHKGAIHKMKKMGIDGKLLSWFEDYLCGRKQQVVVDGLTSDTENLLAGVPQGSILGPMIFLIYINDLVEVVNSQVRLYADDTSLYIDYANPITAANQLQRDIEMIERWAKKWHVTFNPSKTESLIFSRKNNIITPQLLMNNRVIQDVDHHKHLGVTFQRNARWTTHIQDTVTKAKKKVDIMRGLTYRLNRKSLERLYVSYVRPLLEYANTLWDNCTDNECNQLEKVQQSAIRVILGAKKGTSHEFLYGESNLEKLVHRRKRQKLIQFYKIQHNMAPATLQELVPQQTRERTPYTLRTGNNISVIKTNTQSLYQSFFPSVIREWNILTTQIKESPTIERFRELITPEKTRTPRRFYCGERKFQIYHNRLRLRCSDLSEDLYNVNIKDTPMCMCGQAVEDAEHYLLECTRYQGIRRRTNIHLFDIDTLLFGDNNITEDENVFIFKLVQDFIKQSKRFEV